MKGQRAVIIKITADRHNSEFKNTNYLFVDSEESYQENSAAFLNFIYEEIEEMRKENK